MNMENLTTSIGALGTDVGTTGMAILGVVIVLASFKWVRRAIGI